MRAGPYRPKWDSPRTVTLPDKSTVKTTWLGMTIGRAIKARERKAPAVFEEPATPAEATGTPEQTIARLERELAQERAASAVRQTVIRTLRAENEEHRARFQEFKAVLANPDLSGNEKIIALVLAGEAHAPTQPLKGERVEWAKVSLEGKPEAGWIGLRERTGLTGNTISKTLERLSQGEAAPFEKHVTRDWRTRKDGTEGYVTAIQVRPLAERLSDTLRVIARFQPDKPKHGGSEAAIEARDQARRCRRHPNAKPVASTVWRCSVPSCKAILEETPLLDHKLGDPEPSPPSVVVARTLGHKVYGPAPANGHAVALDHQLGGPANDNGHDSEDGAQDQRAAALVAAPPGG